MILFKFTITFLSFASLVWSSPRPSYLPVNPGGIGGLFKGPNSETIIQGPDGSIITAAAEGGAITIDSKLEPIVVAEPEIQPILASIPSEVVPLGPVAEEIVQLAPIAEQVPVAVEVEKEQSSDLVGPSGRITTRGDDAIIAGPASTTIKENGIVAKAPPILDSSAVPVVAVAAAQPVSIPVASIQNIGSSVEINGGPVISSRLGSINQLPVVSSTPSPIIFDRGPIISSSLSPPLEINNQIDLRGLDQSSLSSISSAPNLAVTPQIFDQSSLSSISSASNANQILDQSSLSTISPLSNLGVTPQIRGIYSARIPGNGQILNGRVDLVESSTPQAASISNSSPLSIQRLRPISISSTISPEIFPNGNDITSANIGQTLQIPVTPPPRQLILSTPSINEARLPDISANLNLLRTQPHVFPPSPNNFNNIPRSDGLLAANIQSNSENNNYVSSSLPPVLLTDTRNIQPQFRGDPNIYSNIQLSDQNGRISSSLGPRYDYVSRGDSSSLTLADLQNNGQVSFSNGQLPIGINDGLSAEAWGRPGRDTKKSEER